MSDSHELTNSPVSQRGNRAGGHIGGRDVITVEGDLHYKPEAPRETKLGQLYRRLRADVEADPQLVSYIGQLEIFTRVVVLEDVVGLDGKLGAAKRHSQIEMATVMKERIFANLRENLFSKTFQTIYAMVMVKIWEAFITHVRPAIEAGASAAEVDRLINVEVITPVAAELDACEDYDGVSITDVRGMLYFLTGNCHLLWH